MAQHGSQGTLMGQMKTKFYHVIAMIHVVRVFAFVDNQPSFVAVLCKFRITREPWVFGAIYDTRASYGVMTLDPNIFSGALPIKRVPIVPWQFRH